MTDENTTVGGQQQGDANAVSDVSMPPFQFDDIVLNEETKPIVPGGESTESQSVAVPPTLPTLDSMAEQDVTPVVTPENSVVDPQDSSSDSFSMPQLASLDEMPSISDEHSSEGMLVEQAPSVAEDMPQAPMGNEAVSESTDANEFVMPTLDMDTFSSPDSSNTPSGEDVVIPSEQVATGDNSETQEELSMPQPVMSEFTEQQTDATDNTAQNTEQNTEQNAEEKTQQEPPAVMEKVDEQVEGDINGSLTEQFLGVQKLLSDLLSHSNLGSHETVDVVGMQSDSMTVKYSFTSLVEGNGLTIAKIESTEGKPEKSTTLKVVYDEVEHLLNIYVNDQLALEERNYTVDDDNGKHYVADKLSKFSALLEGNISKIKKQKRQAEQERAERKKLLNQIRDF